MLVVSRRVGEEILVPDLGIVFRILEVRGNKVRVGVTAPPNIRVQRRELWERIQRGQPAGSANGCTLGVEVTVSAAEQPS
jgi:carbon storage regulator